VQAKCASVWKLRIGRMPVGANIAAHPYFQLIAGSSPKHVNAEDTVGEKGKKSPGLSCRSVASDSLLNWHCQRLRNSSRLPRRQFSMGEKSMALSLSLSGGVFETKVTDPSKL